MDLYILRSSFDCKNLIKPEIHNVSQRRQSLRPSHGERYHAEKTVKIGCVVSEIWTRTDTQTRRQRDRQTDKYTHSSYSSATRTIDVKKFK